MSDEVITSLAQVTTEWLTGVLANSGALTRGSVTAFDVDTGGGNWSKHAKLALRYVDGSQGALPQRLFLKMVKTDGGDGSFGPSEVTYYTRDYVDVEDALLVRCYDAAYSEAKQRYHLLLDDLSETHCAAYRKMPNSRMAWLWQRAWRQCMHAGGARNDLQKRRCLCTMPRTFNVLLTSLHLVSGTSFSNYLKSWNRTGRMPCVRSTRNTRQQ